MQLTAPDCSRGQAARVTSMHHRAQWHRRLACAPRCIGVPAIVARELPAYLTKEAAVSNATPSPVRRRGLL
jgi:hypothetical protein